SQQAARSACSSRRRSSPATVAHAPRKGFALSRAAAVSDYAVCVRIESGADCEGGFMTQRWGSRWNASVFVAAWVAASAAAGQVVDRAVAPVVITGAQLPQWSRLAATIECAPYPSGTTGGRDAHNGTVVVPPDLRTGVPVDEIAAYRWNGLGLTEIPVQVDQKYFYCLSNPASSFAFYSGTDKELTYAWDVEAWKKTDGTCSAAYPTGVGPTPDPVATFDNDDEIAFMARDAGPQAPLAAIAPPGASDGQ